MPFSGLKLRVHNEKLVLISQTYVVGTEKNWLNEPVLLRTKNIC